MLPAQFGARSVRRRLQHPFVQERHPFVRPAELDEDAALGHDPRRHEVAVAVSASDGLDLARFGHRLLAAVEGGLDGEVEEVPLLGTLRLVGQQTLGTAEPATADRLVALQEVAVGGVEGAVGGPAVVRGVEIQPVGLLPGRHRFVHQSEPPRRVAQRAQVVGVERGLLPGGEEVVVGAHPVVRREGGPGGGERLHRFSSDSAGKFDYPALNAVVPPGGDRLGTCLTRAWRPGTCRELGERPRWPSRSSRRGRHRHVRR